jgi:hypothetical protein
MVKMQDRAANRMARLGYAARGVVYVLVGALAFMAALGSGGRTTDTKGALATLVWQPFGSALLAGVALGLFCFAAWRLAQSVLDADQLGTEWKAIIRRAGFAVSAVANAGLGLYAAGLALGTAARARDGESSARDWTAQLLSAPFGQLLVGAVGLIVLGTGIAIAIKGWKGNVEENLRLTPTTRAWVVPLGRFGYLARGLVFVIIGGFLLLAAVHADAGEAHGLGGALMELRKQPYGWSLLGVSALGLFAFGAFEFVVAGYRRIAVPEVGATVTAVKRQAEAVARSIGR